MPFHDFDAAWAEHEARRDGEPSEPITVRLLGEEWELPGDMPAALIVRGARLVGGADRDLTMAELIRFVMPIVPVRILDRWLDEGIGEAKLGWVLKRILAIYTGRDPSELDGTAAVEDGDEVGEGKAGTGESSPASSNGGDSSKPTSPANTTSTSTSSSGK